MLRFRKLKAHSLGSPSFGIALLLLGLGAHAAVGAPAADDSTTSTAGDPDDIELMSCLDPAAVGAASLLAEKVTLDLRDVTIVDAVSALQDELALPISFIEAPQAAGKVTLDLENVPVAEVIDHLLSQGTTSYRCDLVRGHVIVYPNREIYLHPVSGVSITDAPRSVAARRYLDGLEVEGLQGIAFFAGGVLEGDMISEAVSLEPEARFIEHLAQILGQNKSVFFVIRDAPSGVRYFTLGAVSPRSAG